MKINFHKMHGLGNDFMLVDQSKGRIPLSTEQIVACANRQTGVGFDQLLLIEGHDQADFYYQIFNADGSEAEQCGNGVRCVARFVIERGLCEQKTLSIASKGGVVDFDRIRVNMGLPMLDPEQIPLREPHQAKRYQLHLFEQEISIMALSMGNPHAVLLVDHIKDAPVARLGPLIAQHQDFPEGVNVGFMALKSRDEIDLRVFERGAGETQACGTGACAAVVAGAINGLLNHEVLVNLSGGRLSIAWQGDGQPVYMTGPAVNVYQGCIAV
jgi:diaminopimelate epimerase